MVQATELKRRRQYKKIASPALLLKLFFAYQDEAKKNPIIKKGRVGRPAKDVFRQSERPLTMKDFEAYCSKRQVIHGLKNYFANTGNTYKDFIEVCQRIETAIRADQIEGGMAGIYNPSITQHLKSKG